MRVSPFAVLAFAAAGCSVLQGGPRPEAAGIAGTTLSVRFTDGSRCSAELTATGGTGQFDGCGGAAYAATIARRNPLEPIFGSAVDPYAEVAVTTEDGAVTRFRLPISREAGFDQGKLG